MSLSEDTAAAPPPPPPPPPPHHAAPPEGDLAGRTGIAVIVGLVALLGIYGGFSMVLVVFAIAVMIFFHELGHYLTAKWAGMKVTEFFLGFGPRIWSFRRGETEYGLKVIPAGAYVRIIGMNNLEEVPAEDEPRAYRSKPFWRRLSVAVAGSTMHFLMALVCVWALFAFHGEARDPGTTPGWTVSSVQADTAASRAGLQPGDRLVAIDGQPVTVFVDLSKAVQPHPGETVTLTVERAGQTLQVPATLGRRSDDATKGFLGVGPQVAPEKYGVLAAVPKAVTYFGRGTVDTFQAIGTVFSPSGLSSLFDRVTGNAPSPTVTDGSSSGNGGSSDEAKPVSIIGATREGAALTRENGWAGLLALLVALNIFVGWINLAPLLPLDGGHVVIAVYEKIRTVLQHGRPYRADVAKMMPVAYATVLLLVFVGLSTMYLDVLDIFGKGS